ncbi:methyltransferase [Faecalibacterium sp. An58]|uniref:class I SAM-dependent methyltransferase n=1 Tax=Faecalibacterium sp. An58 TaxID=1965648 RepID=UPI000B3909A1|nr:class I SAM-dependent methyltransferase [Faecalibacterium sp. An58]OUN69457.1 methyltransferase [Faecalibacterium sp. An58]
MALDARLAAAAELCRPGLPVADVGCDHGKLTAALACSGLYPRVIGTDLRPGPLAKARRTVEQAQCQDRVQLRLGDGLSVLSAGEVGTVVIAGVSAQTAWQMLEAAPWVSDPGGPRLVLIPATRHDELRRWLAGHGFRLVCDRPVEAAGRWYAVMAAEYDGACRQLTLAQALYGDTGRWPEAAGYQAKQREKLAKLRLGTPDGTPAAREIDQLLKGE